MKGFKQFFVNPPVQGKRLTIRGIGVHEKMVPCIVDRPTGTGDFLFMLFYNDVAIGAGGKPAACKLETLMLWTPDRPQYYGNLKAPFDHTWIHCDGSFVRAQLARLRLPCNRPFLLTDIMPTERDFLMLHEELTHRAGPDLVIVENILQNWFHEIARQLKQPAAPGQTPPLALLAVKHRLESEYEKPAHLADLAEKACMSVPHFCALFKKHFGTSAIDYQIRVRMQQAVYWLKDRNLTIGEVASRVGYDDIFYFSKLFKKHYGVSPRAMRTGWAKTR
jgi:AraC family transcriptional regulator, arabinose operon regulatory protein